MNLYTACFIMGICIGILFMSQIEYLISTAKRKQFMMKEFDYLNTLNSQGLQNYTDFKKRLL